MPKDSIAFLDTCILVYVWDTRDPDKHRLAVEFLRMQGQRLVISSQVCQEFASVMLKRIGATNDDVHSCIEFLRKFLGYLPIEIEQIQGAVMLSAKSKISFWDALIVESAAASGCKILYTDDLNHRQTIRGVKIVNPFK
jgi:predicted nucleic acid-binding protein